MDWTSKNDQQQDALLTTFYMLIAMILMVIRTGLDVRNVPASFSYAPYDDAPLDNSHLSSRQANQLDELYARAMMLLYAAQVVARMLGNLTREIYELMKQAYGLAQSLRSPPDTIAGWTRPADPRLDAP